MYPSIVIANSNFNTHEGEWIKKEIQGIAVAYKTNLNNRVIERENLNYFLFAHVNEATRKNIIAIPDDLLSDETIFDLQGDIHWGLICLINKHNGRVQIINDPFGIYPAYLLQQDSGFYISNDFDLLMSRIDKAEINIHGLYDYLLFNYTLNSNTLIKEISQLSGGTLCTFFGNEVTIKTIFDIAESLDLGKRVKVNKKKLAGLFKDYISEDIIPGKPVKLSLSGGFDSKVTLSALLSTRKPFSAFTFGAKGSTDHKAAAEIAERLDLDYSLLETDKEFIDEAERYIKDFVNSSPAMPLILDLLSYSLVKEKVASSNIITGVMGGELIAGPVVISEVIITRFAALLTGSQNRNQLKETISEWIKDFPFIEQKFFMAKSENYVNSLSGYLCKSDDTEKHNLINFLLKETYGKFFGVVFRNLFHKFNMINPFTNREFLKVILNSDTRFTRFPSFSRNPVSHYFSKRIYFDIIKETWEPVLNMPMDRGYVIADAYYFHRFPKVMWNFVKNKIFKRNKANHLKTLNYTKWLEELMVKTLKDSPVTNWPVFNADRLKGYLKNEPNKSEYLTRKMIIILSLHYFNEKYGKKLTFNSSVDHL